MSEAKKTISRSKCGYIIRLVLFDILLIGITLCSFAYFHHVKNDMVSDDIVIDLGDEINDERGSSTVVYWRDMYADKFSDELIQDDMTYKSKDISVTIEKREEKINQHKIEYYVADVYIADIKCVQRYFAKGNVYGKDRDEVIDMHEESGAVITISGDTYLNAESGIVIQDGVVCRSKKSSRDICVLFADGTMKTYGPKEFELEEIMEQGPWQAWCFGPELLDDNGKAKTKMNVNDYLSGVHPRAGIGYYAPGHYCFVIVEGRNSEYDGVDIKEFAQIFENLGCVCAYNLDGGGSSCIVSNDKYVSSQSGNERKLSDCIILKEVAENEAD